MNGRPADAHSFGWFLAIGALAGAVHYAVTLGLNLLAGIRPGYANVCGFLCAFPVSYIGHRALSFAASDVPHRHALPRLLAVSGFGFAANQSLLLLLLATTPLPLAIALAVVLVVVAVSTFLLSRGWVFVRRSTSPHDAPDHQRR